MTHCVAGMVVMVVLLAGAAPGWSQQQYLYAPKAVDAGVKVQKKDGVLVREVEVRKGDTLFGISRRFSGHGTYYPQILLFNEIKDPNLIYPGNLLRIPVSRYSLPDRAAEAAPVEPVAAVPSVDAKHAVAEGTRRDLKHAAAVPAITPAGGGRLPAAAASSEQLLFERAIKAYRHEDLRTALELFDRFLDEYPSSALAADASLYKAECYLKQSGQ